MVTKLRDFSQHPGHAMADCTVVCILSHGEEGYIFGADGRKFELDAIFQLFDNTCCPDLRGKPKLFIIQACRGGNNQFSSSDKVIFIVSLCSLYVYFLP